MSFGEFKELASAVIAAEQLPPEEADDRTLLSAVAGQSSRDAFEQLYQRCERSAYNLALHIASSPELAEEAVQEGMLRVWQTAASYRGEGSVRSWILRIIAGKALEQLKRKRKSQRLDPSGALEPERVNPPGNSLEHCELLGALSTLLFELPESERQMMALYFGGGMTQQEVSAALHIPRRTVSHKIDETCKYLRSRLIKAGFSAVLPMLSAEGLRDALCSGATPPAALSKSVSAALRLGVKATTSFATRVTALKSSSGVLIAVFVALIAIGACGYSFWPKSTIGSAPRPLSAPAPEALSAPAAPAVDLEAWQPVAVQPQRKRHADLNFNAGDQHGRAFMFGYKDGGDADWQVSATPAGTTILQPKLTLADHNIITIDEMRSGAREWSAILDETGAAAGQGEIGFDASAPGVPDKIFGRHAVSGKTASLRIVAWPIAGGVRIASLRKVQGEKSFHAGAETIKTDDGRYNIGFITNTAMTIREFRVRNLPKDWKPENDPELASFAVRKSAGD